jgi:murein DD-endopeptidase MepM/ murein hydrolase activator NlpD
MKLSIPNVEPLVTDSIDSSVHDNTTLPENISPITVPAATTSSADTQTPTVTPPTVTSPTTGEQVPQPGTTMVVTNPVTESSYPVVITPSTGATSYTIPSQDIRGYYAQPISGRLSQGIHDVNAVDIAAPTGTTVHAAANGTVIVAMGDGKYNGGYGNYIVVSHPNGTQTLYAHLSKVNVAIGEEVIQGEPIALSGATGKVTGAHLHFEVRGAINPWGADTIGTIYTI